jgi:glutamine amidotransferase
MLAFNGGKTVHYSTYKTSCPIKDSCRYYNQSCENESKDKVNHLIISSEPLSGENVWLPTNPGSFLGIDSQMKFYLSH